MRITEEQTADGLVLRTYAGDTQSGLLRCTHVHNLYYTVAELAFAGEQHTSEIALLFGERLAAFCREKHGIIYSFDAPPHKPVNDLLAGAGFAIKQRKAYFDLALENYRSTYSSIFTYRSLIELGEERFAEILGRAAEGDPFEETPDPLAALHELIDSAGAAFDASRWKIAYVQNEPVGAVLPQIYPDSATRGTLFYIGVLPEYRGRGYGRMLHALGLEELSRHGATRYVGSTDERNVPMIHVFRANKCNPRPSQLFFVVG